MIIFDLETPGRYEEIDTIHMMCIYDMTLKRRFVYKTLEEIRGFIFKHFDRRGTNQSVGIGHNIIGFDLPVLQKVFPDFQPHNDFKDTLVMSRLIFSELSDADTKLCLKGKLPARYKGSHSLAAWGYRLGDHKGDFKGPWKRSEVTLTSEELDAAIDGGEDYTELEAAKVAKWLADMEEYCIQDVMLTKKLYEKLAAKEYSSEAIELEHQVQWIVQRQVRYGVRFDTTAAQSFYGDLMIRRDELTRELVEAFGSWYERDGKDEFFPKRDSAIYYEGAPLCRVKQVTFNPGSRQHIGKILKKRYGWKPEKLTETGLPEINEKVLSALLKYKHVDKLLEFFIVDKRMSQLNDGDAGWLKKVAPDGRIRGNVNTNGTVTGRMTHSGPNLAQVPKVGKPYGHECRSLFTVPKGKRMVGCDASQLEGRTLAHYTAHYDDGEYAKILLEGDVHWDNAKALQLVDPLAVRVKTEGAPLYEEHKRARDLAKTWFYAWLYGAGDKKLAVILGVSEAKAKVMREAFLKNAGPLGRLQADIQKVVKKNGHLKGIDKRILEVRSEHSALNTLLQSCGAIIMKKALVILDTDLQKMGWKPGVDYEFLLNIHDEFQLETTESKAEFLAATCIEAIRKAGKHFNLRVPMEGDAVVGTNWAETH